MTPLHLRFSSIWYLVRVVGAEVEVVGAEVEVVGAEVGVALVW